MFSHCKKCLKENTDSNFKTCTHCESKMCIDCYQKHLCPQCLEDFVNFCYENKLCINDVREIINEHIENIINK